MFSSSTYQPQERGGILVELLKAKQVSPDSTDTADTEEDTEDDAAEYYESVPICMKVQCGGCRCQISKLW